MKSEKEKMASGERYKAYSKELKDDRLRARLLPMATHAEFSVKLQKKTADCLQNLLPILCLTIQALHRLLLPLPE